MSSSTAASASANNQDQNQDQAAPGSSSTPAANANADAISTATVFTADFDPRSFSTIEEAKEWIQSFALERGFGVTTRSSYRSAATPKISLQCACGGLPRNHRGLTPSTRQRQRKSNRCGCPFLIDLVATSPDTWLAKVINASHNHQPVHVFSEMPAILRKLTNAEMDVVRQQWLHTSNAVELLAKLKEVYPESRASTKEITNALTRLRWESNTGSITLDGVHQWLQSQSQSTQWQYKYGTLPDSDSLDRIVFLNTEMIDAVHRWGSVLHIDVTYSNMYSVNRYRMPLVEFSGMTASGQTYIAGYALTQDCSREYLDWSIKTFIEMTACPAPDIVINEENSHLKEAMDTHWPKAFKMLNREHVDKSVLSHAKVVLHKNRPSHITDTEATSALERFEMSWKKYFTSSTSQKVDSAWTELHSTHSNDPLTSPLVQYVTRVWLPHRERYELPSVNCHRHFSSATTHLPKPDAGYRSLKQRLVNRKGTISSLMTKLQDHITQLQLSYHQVLSRDKRKPSTELIRLDFFSAVTQHISTYALRKVLETSWKYRHHQQGSSWEDGCQCQVCVVNGWPCAKKVRYFVDNQMGLQKEHFHTHWWIDIPKDSNQQPGLGNGAADSPASGSRNAQGNASMDGNGSSRADSQWWSHNDTNDARGSSAGHNTIPGQAEKEHSGEARERNQYAEENVDDDQQGESSSGHKRSQDKDTDGVAQDLDGKRRRLDQDVESSKPG
ncbi:unnamed protein product [Sympodiomycopsis kandeliae]